jgi:hypothetical protein
VKTVFVMGNRINCSFPTFLASIIPHLQKTEL